MAISLDEYLVSQGLSARRGDNNEVIGWENQKNEDSQFGVQEATDRYSKYQNNPAGLFNKNYNPELMSQLHGTAGYIAPASASNYGNGGGRGQLQSLDDYYAGMIPTDDEGRPVASGFTATPEQLASRQAFEQAHPGMYQLSPDQVQFQNGQLSLNRAGASAGQYVEDPSKVTYDPTYGYLNSSGNDAQAGQPGGWGGWVPLAVLLGGGYGVYSGLAGAAGAGAAEAGALGGAAEAGSSVATLGDGGSWLTNLPAANPSTEAALFGGQNSLTAGAGTSIPGASTLGSSGALPGGVGGALSAGADLARGADALDNLTGGSEASGQGLGASSDGGLGLKPPAETSSSLGGGTGLQPKITGMPGAANNWSLTGTASPSLWDSAVGAWDKLPAGVQTVGKQIGNQAISQFAAGALGAIGGGGGEDNPFDFGRPSSSDAGGGAPAAPAGPSIGTLSGGIGANDMRVSAHTTGGGGKMPGAIGAPSMPASQQGSVRKYGIGNQYGGGGQKYLGSGS